MLSRTIAARKKAIRDAAGPRKTWKHAFTGKKVVRDLDSGAINLILEDACKKEGITFQFIGVMDSRGAIKIAHEVYDKEHEYEGAMWHYDYWPNDSGYCHFRMGKGRVCSYSEDLDEATREDILHKCNEIMLTQALKRIK